MQGHYSTTSDSCILWKELMKTEITNPDLCARGRLCFLLLASLALGMVAVSENTGRHQTVGGFRVLARSSLESS